ncbi:hypothetical protein MASR1M60_31800 [Rhodocyclaceae bacterium]
MNILGWLGDYACDHLTSGELPTTAMESTQNKAGTALKIRAIFERMMPMGRSRMD